MSISSIQNSISRVLGQLADLRRKDADLSKQESDAGTKARRAREAAQSSRSQSTINSKLREHDQAISKVADVQKKRADVAKQIAAKTSEHGRYESQLLKEQESVRKKAADEQKKLQKEREAHERRLTSELRSRQQLLQQPARTAAAEQSPETPSYDVFISHASEDKDDFARPLADLLSSRGAKVWFDEAVLQWGDSLRRKIDAGLAAAQFGVVILSPDFFRKEWPQRELDGLTSQEIAGGLRILPIWHRVTIDEVRKFSPVLADKLALNTAVHSAEHIADQLIQLLK